MNPKREKKANTAIESMSACSNKKEIPVNNDSSIAIISLSFRFKIMLVTVPRKIVTQKKIPFMIR